MARRISARTTKIRARTATRKGTAVRRSIRRNTSKRIVKRTAVRRSAAKRAAAKRTARRAPVKRRVAKRPAPLRRKPQARARPRASRSAKIERQRVGRVSHFFTNIKVAVVETEAPLRAGDKILIEGATTAFRQTAKSMQINKRPVQLARRGSSIGLKVRDRARINDVVYRLG